MWKNFLSKSKEPDPPIVALARKGDLDQETAFTICKLFETVGSEVVKDWDWEFLKHGGEDYRKLIDIRLLRKAWKVLVEKRHLSIRPYDEEDKRISTLAPLAGLERLDWLELGGNLIEDLGPIAEMTRLKYLGVSRNRIADVSPLRSLLSLEELHLGCNPLTSLRVLEELPKLRELYLSTSQIAVFSGCRSLPTLGQLRVNGDETMESFEAWPEMPSLRVLKVDGMQHLDGVERFSSLETLGCYGGNFSDLTPLSALKRLTHVILCNGKPLDATPLSRVHTLRSVSINCPKAQGVASLSGLPALHEVHMDDENTCDTHELESVRKDLTSWENEFKAPHKGLTPSMHLEIVDQETFDYYDSKASYGVAPDECDTGMLNSEREWLLDEINSALAVFLKEDTDFQLPMTSGVRRSERVILYTEKACESLREVALVLQRILCATKNDWILWLQALPSEGPDESDSEDFIVWVYPQKIVVTREHERIVRSLIEWETPG